jgi:hypothetical protein
MLRDEHLFASGSMKELPIADGSENKVLVVRTDKGKREQ